MSTSYLQRYDHMCDHAAAQVIARYSTSFSLSTRLLAAPIRRDIRNLYAMVRIADEIVDGTALAAAADPATALDAYEAQILAAPHIRFHTDPVVHAYANTARRCNFTREYVESFFASMRRDLTQTVYTASDVDAYVYGSAEVIGLLCLEAFLIDADVTPSTRSTLESGARALGSAFQKVNFLRDFGEDRDRLGRVYYELTAEKKNQIVAEIREELAHANRAIPLLPRSARTAVAAASGLFEELTDIADATPVEELAATRISVPTTHKLRITAKALARGGTR